MMHVYLDDIRRCPEGFVYAKNKEECILLLQSNEVDILSLDYDLGLDEPTGFDVVQEIVLSNLWPKQIYLHTSSDYGRRRMYELLFQAKPASTTLNHQAIPDAVLAQIKESSSS
ncbi:cyclic-phosphate processing receiver domain-containing protein [Longirhabdus pacifica]|uniref:cyclic-phosphate processing receiver domain-containing protein n=1 Tax=Longirhabdus pacifica TaxID=2305227 RepID=UPI0010091639|nr:cyclic-phosphate processing receiver domain-containing protein [Longirhabdus pacifica]